MTRNIIIFALLLIGLWLVVEDNLTYERNSFLRRTISKHRAEKPAPFYMKYFRIIVAWVAGRLSLSKTRQNILSRQLKAADIPMTPEEYIADAIVQPVLFVLVAGPIAYFIAPFLAAGIVLMAAILFRAKLDVADEKLREKRLAIEREMPTFAAVAGSHFQYSRDVISLFEKYRMSSGPAFRSEIEVTLADCKTGSIERALLSMDNRVQSKGLSQVLRGILAVCRGDVDQQYFQQIQKDFQIEERENLRRVAQEKPGKLKPYQYGLLFIFLAAVLYGLISQVITATTYFS